MRALAILLCLTSVVLAQEDETRSKKAKFLEEKSARKDVHLRKSPTPAAPTPVLTIRNVWTQEVLPVSLTTSAPIKKKPAEAEGEFDELTRCHYTNVHTHMDERLLPIILAAAKKFKTTYVEIVSGFRAPKYQLMLRKKGHEVARDSEHPKGNAVDFRLPAIPVRQLLAFVRSLKLGGVGFYPDSKFVHADTGRIRFWKGH